MTTSKDTYLEAEEKLESIALQMDRAITFGESFGLTESQPKAKAKGKKYEESE